MQLTRASTFRGDAGRELRRSGLPRLPSLTLTLTMLAHCCRSLRDVDPLRLWLVVGRHSRPLRVFACKRWIPTFAGMTKEVTQLRSA